MSPKKYVTSVLSITALSALTLTSCASASPSPSHTPAPVPGGIHSSVSTTPAPEPIAAPIDEASAPAKTTSKVKALSGKTTVKSKAAASSRTVATLNTKTVVVMGKTSGAWVRVSAGKTTGWVPLKSVVNAKRITSVTLSTKRTVLVGKTKAPLNLRAKASVKSKALRVLAKGATVTVERTSGAWKYVKSGSQRGWVKGVYLSVRKQTVKPKATTSSVIELERTSVKSASKASGTKASVGSGSAKPSVPAVKVPDAFVVTGAGWGHGVGMSQYGARTMANAGKSASEILQHYYNPAKVTTNSNADRNIVVQMIRTSKASLSVASGHVRLVQGGRVKASGSGSLTATIEDGEVSVSFRGKEYVGDTQVQWQNTRAWRSGSSNTVVSIAKADNGLGTVPIRHGVIDLKNLNGQVNVTNTLRLNSEYLNGLAEVPSSWPEASLQAQAIAARTYSLRQVDSLKKACACNVYDEVDSQKYTGWRKENEGTNAYYGKRWVSAVKATGSKVITYQGSLITSTYFSSSGGRTRASKDVWGGNYPYLQSRDDRYSLGTPGNSWSATVSQKTLAQAFGVKDIVSVSIRKNSDLTIATATAKTKEGKSSTITGKAFRSAFSGRSPWMQTVTAKK